LAETPFTLLENVYDCPWSLQVQAIITSQYHYGRFLPNPIQFPSCHYPITLQGSLGCRHLRQMPNNLQTVWVDEIKLNNFSWVGGNFYWEFFENSINSETHA